MQTLDFETFKADALAAGYDEAVVREWGPSTEVGTHTHPFKASALVTQGEMWLTRGETTSHLEAGDRFLLEPGEPHSERYGASGATYWVARRNGPGEQPRPSPKALRPGRTPRDRGGFFEASGGDASGVDPPNPLC